MPEQDAPIGFLLFQAAKITTASFEALLFGRERGTLSTWLVLLALQATGSRTQADLAALAGIQGPTLTHHLNAMESEGLISRTRTKTDRRIHLVTITKAGKTRFRALQAKAKVFDEALRKALKREEILMLRDLLQRLSEAAQIVSSSYVRR